MLLLILLQPVIDQSLSHDISQVLHVGLAQPSKFLARMNDQAADEVHPTNTRKPSRDNDWSHTSLPRRRTLRMALPHLTFPQLPHKLLHTKPYYARTRSAQ